MNLQVPIEHLEECTTLTVFTNELASPIMIDQDIYCVAGNGDVLKLDRNGQIEVAFTILGQPSSLCFREETNSFLISDFAHQSIFTRQENSNEPIHNLISEYNDNAFCGPHSICIGPISKNMYFTDSGPFQQTSLQYSKGSLFVYKFDTKKLKSIADRTLAFPAGLSVEEHEKFLLVCEMGQNRILKFPIDESSSGNCSVFHQFSGRFGPSAIVSLEGQHYVSLFEFEGLSSQGVIAVLNNAGELVERYTIPTGPQITGIGLAELNDSTFPDSLLITEGKKLHRVSLKKIISESKLSQSIVIAKS